jgi:glycosyltransferase domain-containing protein
VCDSSEKPFPFKDKYDIEYLHYPNMDYVEKLWRTFCKVKTKYVIMCGDDDFIAPGGIAEGVKFLDKNPAYSTVQGHTMVYLKNNSKVTYYQTPYSLDGDEYGSPVERIKHLPMYEIMYALHYTKSFRKIFKFGTTLGHNNTVEHVLLIESFIEGKNKVLPMVLSVKEYMLGTKQHHEVGLLKVRKSYKKEYGRMMRFLVGSLKKKVKISAQEAEELIDTSIFLRITGAISSQRKNYQVARYFFLKSALTTMNFVSERLAMSMNSKYIKLKLKRYEIRKEKMASLINCNEIKRIDETIRKYEV